MSESFHCMTISLAKDMQTIPVLVCRFFQFFLFSGESHLANFNFSKPFFQSNWKVKIKTHLNNIRIFQNLVFLFSGKRLFLPKWKILFPEKRKTCKQAPPMLLMYAWFKWIEYQCSYLYRYLVHSIMHPKISTYNQNMSDWWGFREWYLRVLESVMQSPYLNV